MRLFETVSVRKNRTRSETKGPRPFRTSLVRKWKPSALRLFSPRQRPRLSWAGKRPQPQFGFGTWDRQSLADPRGGAGLATRCMPASRGEAREYASPARSRETRNTFIIRWGRPLSAAYPCGARADLETIPPERQLAVPTRDQGWT
jgi:hypothetical protein